MSLINDALKKAKQTQQKPSVSRAGAPLRPAEHTRSVNAPRSLLLPILAAALLVLVGGILIVVALSRGFGLKPGEPEASKTAVVSPKDNPGTAATSPRTADVPPATSISTPTAVFQPVPTNPPSPAAVVTPVVPQSVVTVESSNSVPAVQVPLEPQLPRLQGIVFNPARPTAFFNGKSVVVGGHVGEYTVLAITKEVVTVERAGQTNVLTMEE